MSSPGLYPAVITASIRSSNTSNASATSGAKPPSSPTVTANPFLVSISFNEWNTSVPIRSASRKLDAPAGTIIYSWKSLPTACLPPFIIFIIGTGSVVAAFPPINLYNGIWNDAAAALAHAIDTARIELAPNLDLSLVPSSFIIALSIAYTLDASIASTVLLSSTFICFTALSVPFPKYLFWSISLSSTASKAPVDAPLGTIPCPTVPSLSKTCASTVGLPLESSISLPITFFISSFLCLCPIIFKVLLLTSSGGIWGLSRQPASIPSLHSYASGEQYLSAIGSFIGTPPAKSDCVYTVLLCWLSLLSEFLVKSDCISVFLLSIICFIWSLLLYCFCFI